MYRCTNLLSDPGQQVGSAVSVTVPGEGTSDPLEMSQSLAQGLYRLRMEPGANQLYYTVSLGGIKWYSLECLEPRLGYYIWGPSDAGPISQYFFVTALPEGETVRVRLQAEKRIDEGRLRVYRKDSEGNYTDQVACLETRSNGTSGDIHPFLTTAEISGEDLPTEGPGEVYKFILSLPTDDTEGPSGNNWVRFSRNVPPYFSNDESRLIYPIIHREFEPVVPTGSTATYRAFLTVPRTETEIVALGSRIRLQIGDTVGVSTLDAYTLSMDSSPESQAELIGDRASARIQNGDIVVADSTDKIDAIWITQPPAFGPDWTFAKGRIPE